MRTLCVVWAVCVVAVLLLGVANALPPNTVELVNYETDFPQPSHLWQATLLRSPFRTEVDIPPEEISTMMRVYVGANGTIVEEVLVVFGGESLGLLSGNTTLNTDTWIYHTFLPQYWERCSPEVTPSPRLGHNMFPIEASPVHDVAYLFGGTNRTHYFNDLWRLQLLRSNRATAGGCQWDLIPTQNSGPSPRTFAALIVSSIDGDPVVYVWGGCQDVAETGTTCVDAVDDADTLHVLHMPTLTWVQYTLDRPDLIGPRSLTAMARFAATPTHIYFFGGAAEGRKDNGCDLFLVRLNTNAQTGTVEQVWGNDFCASTHQWLRFEARFALVAVEDSLFFIGAASTEESHGTLTTLAYRPRDNLTVSVASDYTVTRHWPVSYGHLNVLPGSFAFAHPNTRGFGFAVGLMQDQWSGQGTVLWQYSPFWRDNRPFLQWHPELTYSRPFPRRGHSLSPASVGDGIFTFGGFVGRVTSFVWTLGPLTRGRTQWRYVPTTGASIPPRNRHLALELGDGHRLVLGGFTAAFTCYADAWLLWVDMSTAVHSVNASRIDVQTPDGVPAWEGAGAMSASCSITTPTHTRCYLFGGACNDNNNNRLFRLDYRPNHASQPPLLLTPLEPSSTGAPAPSPRENAALFAGTDEEVLLFGGLDVTAPRLQHTLGDVWRFDVQRRQWNLLYMDGAPATPVPGTQTEPDDLRRHGRSAAYDDGGDAGSREKQSTTRESDTSSGNVGTGYSALNRRNNNNSSNSSSSDKETRAALSIERAPPPRYLGCSLRASATKWLIFGGRDATQILGDLWEYDANSGAFSQLHLHAGENALRGYHASRWGQACTMHEGMLLAHGGVGVFDILESTVRMQPGCNELEGLIHGESFLNGTCQICPVGTFYTPQAATCQDCPTGTTTEEEGSRSCDACVPNYCRYGHACVVVNQSPQCNCRPGYQGDRCEVFVALYVTLALVFGLGTVGLVAWLFRRQRRAHHKAALKEKLLSHATDQLREKDMELQELARVFVIDPEELVLQGALDLECPGASGDVWKGRYKNQVVAVKRLKAELLAMDETQLDLFEREVKLMRGLRHKNIVLFYGAGMFEQQPFLVMEYCPRGSLHRVLTRALSPTNQDARRRSSRRSTLAAAGRSSGGSNGHATAHSIASSRDDGDDGSGVNGRRNTVGAAMTGKQTHFAMGSGGVWGSPRGSSEGLNDERVVLDWSRRFQFLIDTAEGMRYLHSLRPPRIHRDLKSMNVLVTEDWTCLISDFGTAKLLWRLQQAASHGMELPHEHEQCAHGTTRLGSIGSADFASVQTTAAGTIQWSAPEVLLDRPYTYLVDVYSFGILGSEVVTQQLPFRRHKRTWDVRKAVLAGERPQLGDGCPPALARLLRECWSEDATKRPGFDEVVERLKAMQADYHAGGWPGSDADMRDGNLHAEKGDSSPLVDLQSSPVPSSPSSFTTSSA